MMEVIGNPTNRLGVALLEVIPINPFNRMEVAPGISLTSLLGETLIFFTI